MIRRNPCEECNNAHIKHARHLESTCIHVRTYHESLFHFRVNQSVYGGNREGFSVSPDLVIQVSTEDGNRRTVAAGFPGENEAKGFFESFQGVLSGSKASLNYRRQFIRECERQGKITDNRTVHFLSATVFKK